VVNPTIKISFFLFKIEASSIKKKIAEQVPSSKCNQAFSDNQIFSLENFNDNFLSEKLD